MINKNNKINGVNSMNKQLVETISSKYPTTPHPHYEGVIERLKEMSGNRKKFKILEQNLYKFTKGKGMGNDSNGEGCVMFDLENGDKCFISSQHFHRKKLIYVDEGTPSLKFRCSIPKGDTDEIKLNPKTKKEWKDNDEGFQEVKKEVIYDLLYGRGKDLPKSKFNEDGNFEIGGLPIHFDEIDDVDVNEVILRKLDNIGKEREVEKVVLGENKMYHSDKVIKGIDVEFVSVQLFKKYYNDGTSDVKELQVYTLGISGKKIEKMGITKYGKGMCVSVFEMFPNYTSKDKMEIHRGIFKGEY